LQSLIEQRLMEQDAAARGLTVTDGEVDAALAQIVAGQGSAKAYTAWLTANQYTEAEFREALRREVLRAKAAAEVAASIPATTEQVHALALLVTDEALAQSLLEQLNAGADFATLAVQYSQDLSSRAAGGDLGWFPRGTLTVPEVENRAFQQQPGETSPVIASVLGFHIIRTLEHDPARPISPGARQILIEHAYQTWIDALVAQASIQTFVTP
jgi:foldase protein PrsA